MALRALTSVSYILIGMTPLGSSARPSSNSNQVPCLVHVSGEFPEIDAKVSESSLGEIRQFIVSSYRYSSLFRMGDHAQVLHEVQLYSGSFDECFGRRRDEVSAKNQQYGVMTK